MGIPLLKSFGLKRQPDIDREGCSNFKTSKMIKKIISVNIPADSL